MAESPATIRAGWRACDARPPSRVRRSARPLLAAVLAALLGGLLGCARPAAPPSLASAGPSGLAGRVLAASDVAGQPDQPLAGQLVLALPLGQAGQLLGAGAQPPTAERLRFLKAPLAAASPALSTAVSDAGGRFALALAPGSYVLCLADPAQPPASFPATTRGCGQTVVPPGAPHQVDISSGFGEILIVER